MSTSDEFIATLQLIQRNLYRVGGLLLMVIGTLSCAVNIIVFTQKNLRKNPCARCFLAFNAASFLLLYLSLLPAILQIGYGIEPGASNLTYCRIRYYLGFLLACLPPFYLILASIDRALLTASHVQVRQWSKCSFIVKCLVGITVFWTFFHTHALIYTDILQYGSSYFVCYFRPGIYSILVSYYTLIVNGIIPLALLSIFGALTMINVRDRPIQHMTVTRSRTHGGRTNHHHHFAFRRKDRQLIRMLLIEILTCLIFNFIHPAVLLQQQITQYQAKSSETQMIEQLVISVSTLSVHIPFCTSLYTNLIVSKTFRKEIKRILFHKHHLVVVRPM